jgi:HD superfamily phosphohydrolase YqeK
MLPSWAVVTPARRAHIERVAALVDQWATTMHVSSAERARWLRAAWLHDALRDAPSTGEMDHGPRCAERLAREGELDQGVLDAVRFHSVGYAGWDDVGRMLYLADHLEPGRPHEADIRAGLRARVAGERDTILKEVARRRIDWTLRSGWPLQPETVAFWNALVTS